MARFRKTLHLVVEGCVLVTLSVTAGVLMLHENVFRQLLLHHFQRSIAAKHPSGGLIMNVVVEDFHIQ